MVFGAVGCHFLDRLRLRLPEPGGYLLQGYNDTLMLTLVNGNHLLHQTGKPLQHSVELNGL